MEEEVITFLSDERTEIGRIVKSLAIGYGFGWKSSEGEALNIDSAVVAVGMDEASAEAVLSRTVSPQFGEQESCATYALDASRPIIDEDGGERPYVGESLADWILCEHYLYGRGQITVLGADGMNPPELQLIERLFDKLMVSLIKRDGSPRAEATLTTEC